MRILKSVSKNFPLYLFGKKKLNLVKFFYLETIESLYFRLPALARFQETNDDRE